MAPKTRESRSKSPVATQRANGRRKSLGGSSQRKSSVSDSSPIKPRRSSKASTKPRSSSVEDASPRVAAKAPSKSPAKATPSKAPKPVKASTPVDSRRSPRKSLSRSQSNVAASERRASKVFNKGTITSATTSHSFCCKKAYSIAACLIAAGSTSYSF